MVVPLEFLVIAETSTFQDGIGKETHSKYNLIPNVEIWKKNSRFARQKNKYSNACVVRKKYSERNKKP
jgi:hypothetical protein